MRALATFSFATLSALAIGCTPADPDPQQVFFDTLAEHCGNAYEGEVVKGNPETDQTWMNSRIVIEIRECQDDRIRVPLHVGENHSRTWVFTQTSSGLQLKHDHRHEDGTHDPVTWYGGTSYTAGTATEQSFPADDFSKQMFSETGLSASIDNTWIVSFPTPTTMNYRLLRENRDFQVEVDLSQPVEAPPAPWGWEDNYQYNFD